MLTFSTYAGAETIALAPALTYLHVECLSGWPYFVMKGVDHTSRFRSMLTDGGDTSLVITARDGDEIVGATAGLRLPRNLTAIRNAVAAQGIDPERVYWITQMTILPKYRGSGASNTLSYMREDHARSLGIYSHIVFSALVRPDDHPLRPADYVPHDGMWIKRGYRHLAGADLELSFVDGLDAKKPSKKTLQLWAKDLK